MLEDLAVEDAARLAERLRVEFAAIEHHSREGEAFHVTFSAGVAALQEGASVSAWADAADRAPYVAKKTGLNCVVAAPAYVVGGPNAPWSVDVGTLSAAHQTTGIGTDQAARSGDSSARFTGL